MIGWFVPERKPIRECRLGQSAAETRPNVLGVAMADSVVDDNATMSTSTLPLQALLLSVSGWVNSQQQQVVEYLIEENRVLKEQL